MKTSNPKPRAWAAWAPQMVADLVTMWRAGSKSWEIAKQLGLTKQAVRSKVSHLRKEGVDLDRRAMPRRPSRQAYPRPRNAANFERDRRRCLGPLHVDEMFYFNSAHKHERLCPNCTRVNAGLAGSLA